MTSSPLGKIIDALEGGAKGSITPWRWPAAWPAYISGCITVTGLASKLLSTIVSLSGGHMIIALVLTMICCCIVAWAWACPPPPTTASWRPPAPPS